MYAGDADYASTEKYGIVRLAREEDLLTQEESLAVSSAILNGYLEKYYLNKVNGDAVTGDVYFRGRTGFTKPILVEGLKGDNEKQYLTRSDTSTAIGSLTIPDDDSRLTQGSKEIAYTSDLTGFVTNTTLNSAISNLVTLNTDQTITGAKTLDNSLYVNSPDMMSGAKSISTEDLHCSSIELGRVWTSKNSDYIYANGYRRISAIAKNGVSIPMITCNTAGAVPNVISFGVSDAYDVIIPARAKTYGGKKFLAQGSVTAGSDNLLITETTDGVQIICNAPTNAQIEVLQRLINDLSTKIDNLTTRLNNLEEVIDGGVAGSIYPADPQKIDADPVVDSPINTGETSGSVDITVEDN